MKKLVADMRILILILSLILSSLAKADEPTPAQITPGEDLSKTCLPCHGPKGNSIIPQTPKLAGQNRVYLMKEMLAFQMGKKAGRDNPVMTAQVAHLNKAQIAAIVAYYSAQKETPGSTPKLYVS